MGILITLASLALLSGCYSIGDRRIADADVVRQIVTGETTKPEVVELIGEPNEIDFDEQDREKWFYEYTLRKLAARNFIPIIGLFTGPDTEKHTLTVLFDSVDIVRRVAGGAARSKDTLQGAGQDVKRVTKSDEPPPRSSRERRLARRRSRRR